MYLCEGGCCWSVDFVCVCSTATPTLSFSDESVAEGGSSVAVISINNADNVTIEEIKLIDAGGNEYVIDENDLTYVVSNANKSRDDGVWRVVLVSGTVYPFNDTSDSAVLDVFTGRKYLRVCRSVGVKFVKC